MLTMSRTCNASECGSWKESYRSSDSVESSSEESDHSSNSSLNTGNGNGNGANNVGSNSNSNNNNSNNNRANNSHLQPPIGCITTHRVSTVIRPERKMPPIDPLQFVKIQKNELSKKAVEQIKLAEEEKITKEKIKEVEEEWQNNLMNWKSKRKLTKNNSEDESLPRNPNRKTKTFSEILNEKAKSGARIGYNLYRYIDPDLEDEFNSLTVKDSDNIEKEHLFDEQEQAASTNMGKTALEKTSNSSSLTSSMYAAAGGGGENDASARLSLMLNNNNNNNNNVIPNKNDNIGDGKSNLDRFLTTTNEQYGNNSDEQISRNGLGEMVVFNTSLLEEFSVKTDCDIQKTVDNNTLNENIDVGGDVITAKQSSKMLSSMDKVNNKKDVTSSSISSSQPEKVFVPINDWKSSHSPANRKSSSLNIQDDEVHQHNSSFELDEEEELDEESEKLRLDQERSFKAKVHTFEALAKQEEEAARRAAEENRKRQQKRAKLAAERSKSLSNLTANPKHLLVASNSVSSTSLQNKANIAEEDSIKTNNPNNRISTNDDTYYQYYRNTPTNSVIYNFKEKSENGATGKMEKTPIKMATKTQTTSPIKIQTKPLNTITKLDHAQPPPPPPQSSLISPQSSNNIYENVSNLTNNIHQNKIGIPLDSSNVDIVPDSDAIRNVSQKLLQQQQQIYQNQPIPAQIKPVPIVAPQPYTNEQHYLTNMPSHNYGGYTTPEMLDEHQLQQNTGNHRGYSISDDVGLPPIQITKSIQSIPPSEEHPVYQNQMMINPACYHTYDNGYNNPETLLMNRREELVSSYRPEPYQQIPYSTTTNPYISTQNAYYPKPYSANNNGLNLHKPLTSTKQPPLQSANRIPSSQNANRYGANGYNPNHWVIQEAELRQSTQRMQQQSQQQMPPASLPPSQTASIVQPQQPPPASTPTTNTPLPTKNPGYLSVSGKKKCSKCGDELGKGCAAMVVESLQLYYHINCFRCSVCNAQLGNGTVGTDVRVRNNKLHCHNCYSNDEAGLKFSRV